jgi:Polyketide cyclase / dehydrase and lipid transport
VTTVRVCKLTDAPAATLYRALVDWGRWDRWSPMLAGAELEPAGAPPATVGVVRSIPGPGGAVVRERLTGCDEEALTVTYVIEPPLPFPARSYAASVRLVPLTDRPATAVEWCARIDADAADEAGLVQALEGFFNGFIDGAAAWAVAPDRAAS